MNFRRRKVGLPYPGTWIQQPCFLYDAMMFMDEIVETERQKELDHRSNPQNRFPGGKGSGSR